MLGNGSIVGEVLFAQGVADSIKPGGIIVDMSSIRPAEAQDHAQKLAQHGVHHIDAPVSGGTVGAEQGTLAIMAGGDPDVFATVEPVLLTMVDRFTSARPGQGSLRNWSIRSLPALLSEQLRKRCCSYSAVEPTQPRCERRFVEDSRRAGSWNSMASG
jgi:hypothetical protein